MSSYTTLDSGINFLYTSYDLSKLFLWDNRFKTENINNSTYNQVGYNAGTIMGRVAATGYIVPFDSTANDGSQFPIGILNQDVIVSGSDIVPVSICIRGDVAGELLVFNRNGDTLNTVVSGKQVQDYLQNAGIIIRTSDSLTITDNA
jgi:hypothetical protein